MQSEYLLRPPVNPQKRRTPSCPKVLSSPLLGPTTTKTYQIQTGYELDSTVTSSHRSHRNTSKRVKWKGQPTTLWSPNQSMPQLHPGSWSPSNANPLLLLSRDGTRYRVIKPLEAARLLGCRRDEAAATPETAAKCALEATPPSLARYLVHTYGQKCLRSSEPEPTKVGVCSLPEEHADEATCFRFVERAHLLPTTPRQHPSDFPPETWKFFESEDVLRLSTSAHFAYSFPRKIHDLEFVGKEIYCEECGLRTSTKKGYLAPGCDTVIHDDCLLHHLASCDLCRDLCESLQGLDGTSRSASLGFAETRLEHYDPSTGAAAGGKRRGKRRGQSSGKGWVKASQNRIVKYPIAVFFGKMAIVPVRDFTGRV